MKFSKVLKKLRKYHRYRRSCWPDTRQIYIASGGYRTVMRNGEIVTELFSKIYVEDSEIDLFDEWNPTSDDLLEDDWEEFVK